LRARYDALADDYSLNAKICGYQIPFRMAKMLEREKISPRNFLDCGSGSGLLGGAIRKTWPDAHVTGMDFSQALLDISIADGCAQQIILCNLMEEKWPIADASFDVVGAASILNYAPDPCAFIGAMAGAVKDGGHIVLSYLSGQSGAQGITDDGSHVYLWSDAEINSALSAHDITLIERRDVRSYSGRGIDRVDNVVVGRNI